MALSCLDSFRDAYARTGMNLVQSIVVFAVAMGQKAWEVVSRQSSVISQQSAVAGTKD